MSDAANIPGEGEKFGRFVLLERVGKGGMAEVFRAKTSWAAGVDKEVCIKRILPPLMDDERMRELFIQEARIAASLTHANIIPVYEFGIIDSYHFLAMEYVDGVTVRDLMMQCARTKRWPSVSETIHMATEVLEGLDYAHRKRDSTGQPLDIVHRDVTPGNVMISRAGEVKILDFGIGQMGVVEAGSRREGKPGYMAPEQLVEMAADRRVDIYALGVMLHEMLSRRRLFKVKEKTERLARANKVQPPSRFNADVPSGLDSLILRALAPKTEERYSSAAEFRDALLDFMHAEGLRAGRSHMAALVGELFGETDRQPSVPSWQTDVRMVDEQSLERQPRKQRITRSHRVTITGGHEGLGLAMQRDRQRRVRLMLLGGAIGALVATALYFVFLHG
jgi:serine/threonine protein kinase